MHCILISLGTDGDVNPYVGLGIKLRERGHQVTLAANEHFRAIAAENGLGFRAMVSNEESAELFAHPDFWHPVKNSRVVAQWGLRFIARQYALLAELADAKDVVLVASRGVVAARLVEEKLSRPLAGLVLCPWLIPSVCAPPVMPGFTLPRWAPRPMGHAYWWLVDAAADHLIARPINKIRQELGLKPVRRICRRWLNSELLIGLFPDWYGLPQPDWPRQMRLAGFPRCDGDSGTELPRDLEKFCRLGEPPIAFTFGTGMMHGGTLFHAAMEACRNLGKRGVFLTKYGQQLPRALPPFIFHCEFARFRQLFPRCAAVVHHGGMGTVAEALAAGTPQLILPLAFDQMDNAARVKRLAAGAVLNRNQRSGPQIAQALTNVMTPQSLARCRALATRFGSDDSLEHVARWVEELDPAAREGRPRSQ